MTTKTDNQQLAFHAWLSRRGIASNYAGDGQYEEPRVQLAWEAWTTAVDEMRPRAAVEAGRQHNSMTIAHAWIRPALNLTEDAPYRFDFYAQKIADLTTDRQSRMPSDEEIDKLSHGFALQYQDHVRNFARALLSRYGSGQPAKPSNSGELGSRPGKSDQCGQPAASAEPPKRPYARSSTLGEYGIIPECDTQPATPASAQATIKDSKIVGETSAQDREDAERYRFIRPGDAMVWCSSGDDLLSGDLLDAAIDAARAAKGE